MLVKLKKFCELTGYTSGAVHQKIARGQWLKDFHYVKAPDGMILISTKSYERWARHQDPKIFGVS